MKGDPHKVSIIFLSKTVSVASINSDLRFNIQETMLTKCYVSYPLGT
ncbi:hypothetical protein SKA53_10864 [Yoonia vestfoldensis SKA53]|uniref:Uncharacterized protein n=1 Tax=Yoonia vestfoldensis SKA53 TaxID=314232 RepID=A3V120_9RHOB|nr:hypothetical protein SKA53_10864 [Yoonia vestfoldensis SKA53]